MMNWGGHISANDDFQDIYHAFYEQYNQQVPVAQIEADMLAIEDFKALDSRTNCLLALALCQWETGTLSQRVLGMVEVTVRSQRDLLVWRELGATEKEIRRRAVALAQFLEKLHSPNPRPRLPRLPKQKAPMLQAGAFYSIWLPDGLFGCAYCTSTATGEIGIQYMALLAYHSTAAPTLAQAMQSPILHRRGKLPALCSYSNRGYLAVKDKFWCLGEGVPATLPDSKPNWYSELGLLPTELSQWLAEAGLKPGL